MLRGQSGVLTYKTKGTVLVFSWCGSGSIMPQKDQERKTEIRKGSCCGARWQHSRKAVRRIFFRVVCTQLFKPTDVKRDTLSLYFKSRKQQRLKKLTALLSVHRFMSIELYFMSHAADLVPPICFLAELHSSNDALQSATCTQTKQRN